MPGEANTVGWAARRGGSEIIQKCLGFGVLDQLQHGCSHGKAVECRFHRPAEHGFDRPERGRAHVQGEFEGDGCVVLARAAMIADGLPASAVSGIAT